MITDRRRFLQATGSAFAALAASGCTRTGLNSAGREPGYGPLVPDPAGMVDLPAGFRYRILSQFGQAMSDGGTVPDNADGMGCFDLGGGRIALVRNHELNANQHQLAGGAIASGYARDASGTVLPGGTVNLVLNERTLNVERQVRTLAGTMRNCAGGTTPWGSWLSCEEPGSTVLPTAKDHGYVFEVPARAARLVNPVPLKAMGRFNHEAACVDPVTGAVYMTEDRDEGLLYRFLPRVRGRLAQGGTLQALAIAGLPDARNWNGVAFAPGSWQAAGWITLDEVEAPADDLRLRGAAAGATVFARGEGLHMGKGEMYFCCTSGGAAKLGQVFRLRPQSGAPDRLQLFFESSSPDQFNYGDNLTVTPHGHLIVCEDQYTHVVDNHLRGIAPDGRAYPLARSRLQTEWAGACFLPNGRILFVNLYSPARTLAIIGPWTG
jgi:secreted PhoX family phosphatase